MIPQYIGSAELDSIESCMKDEDDDGYGDSNVVEMSYGRSDCDDENVLISPDDEVCDEIDNDCDSLIDDDDVISEGAGSEFFEDTDSDQKEILWYQ